MFEAYETWTPPAFDTQSYQTLTLQELEFIYEHSMDANPDLGKVAEAMKAVARDEGDANFQ